VFRRVFVFRRIAAANVSAGKAEPQVHPCVTQFHAVFANVLIGCCELNFVCVLAFHLVTPIGSHGSQLLQEVPLVVAYEPVWAIGTGKTATPQLASDAHIVIRGEAAKAFGQEFADKLRILYGGSVKPENAKALMSEEEIDGALVGGASLDPKSFATIVKY
jgi:hypothetical protein